MALFSFIFGALIGSFLNVVINRLPLKESVVFPRSYCPKCNHKIFWYHNIPIFSYIFLKGKCAYCQKSISINYLVVELLSAFLTLALFLKIGLELNLFLSLVFFYTLIVLSFIDFKYKAVPDYLLLIVFLLSFFITEFSLIDALKASCILLGAFVILNFLITFYIQNIKAKILKDESLKTQQALGEGDFPILAAIGVVLGLKGAFVAIFLSSIFAIIPSIYFNIKKKDIQTPYIPYLVLGFIVEYFFNISRVFN
ncbi:prepilin peptidase [Halarcobacter ebronensis]|uniref:Prepilin leader peptidase/N-methyltransferase n=1 Tax=Halarcobacter ebronensis TaxID=1462615 RepID=A0A4Q0YAS8_9BACT|nr:A24 family peptidase [Halarcobacter ebronensis]RXJ66634.1 prepilin peptidase [Halarcobacter ebronensis]